MKFDISREELQEVLTNVGIARDKRGYVDAHKGILFDVKDGILTLTATNPEYSISKAVKLNLGYYEDLSFVSDGELVDIVNKLDGEDVTIELLDKNVMKISSGKFRCEQPAMQSELYLTNKPDGECEGTQTLKSEQLESMIKSVIHACAVPECGVDRIRTGVKLTAKDGKIDVVALDGKRIAAAFGDYDGNIDIVIPGKLLKEAMKLIKGDVTIKQYQNCYILESDGYTITSSALEGTYPDWKRIMPKEFAGVFAVDKTQMLRSIERLKVIANGEKKPLIFDICGEKLKLSLRTQRSSGTEEVKTETIGETGNTRVGLNYEFILEALKAMTDSKIIIKYKSAVAPIVMSNENGDRIQIVMSIKIE